MNSNNIIEESYYILPKNLLDDDEKDKSTFFKSEFEKFVSENFEFGNLELDILVPWRLASSKFKPEIKRSVNVELGLELFLYNFLASSEIILGWRLTKSKLDLSIPNSWIFK